MNYYTYAYLREDGTPYYIGKGKGNRAYKTHHFGDPPPSDRILILKYFESEFNSYKHEKYLINILGKKLDGGILININDGGEGGSSKGHCKGHSNHTPEQIRKARENALLRNENQKGSNNRNAKAWKITYSDGRVLIRKSIHDWAMEQGYSKSGISNLKNGKWKYYKDLISIEKYC